MIARYPITPVPKPRQTQSDKWKKRPAVLRYRAFADEVRLRGVTVENGDTITFSLPMPKSWNKMKRLEYVEQPHTVKPDIDNLLKSLLDAVHSDDSHIWTLNGISKRWGIEGQIVIERQRK